MQLPRIIIHESNADPAEDVAVFQRGEGVAILAAELRDFFGCFLGRVGGFHVCQRAMKNIGGLRALAGGQTLEGDNFKHWVLGVRQFRPGKAKTDRE